MSFSTEISLSTFRHLRKSPKFSVSIWTDMKVNSLTWAIYLPEVTRRSTDACHSPIGFTRIYHHSDLSTGQTSAVWYLRQSARQNRWSWPKWLSSDQLRKRVAMFALGMSTNVCFLCSILIGRKVPLIWSNEAKNHGDEKLRFIMLLLV